MSLGSASPISRLCLRQLPRLFSVVKVSFYSFSYNLTKFCPAYFSSLCLKPAIVRLDDECSFYRAANAIFAKVCRFASEEMILTGVDSLKNVYQSFLMDWRCVLCLKDAFLPFWWIKMIKNGFQGVLGWDRASQTAVIQAGSATD